MPGAEQIPVTVTSTVKIIDDPSSDLDLRSINLADHIGLAEAKTWDRTMQLAVVASRMVRDGYDHPDVGIVLGTKYGNMNSTVSYLRRLQKRGPRLVSPLQFAWAGTGVPAAMVAIDSGIDGHHQSVSQGDLSGAWALYSAIMAIHMNRARYVICGAVDCFGDSEGAALVVLTGLDRSGLQISIASDDMVDGCDRVSIDVADSGSVGSIVTVVNLLERGESCTVSFVDERSSISFAIDGG